MQPETVSSAEARDAERRGYEKELSELRREVIEARNLVIKTDNLLKNLHAELKVVSKRNDDAYKRTWFASAAAYGIFLVLAIGVAVFASRASVATERAQVESAQAEAAQARALSEQATAQHARLKTEQQTIRTASEQAFAAFQKMNEGGGEARLQGIDELAQLDRQNLTALEQAALEERARALKGELGQAAYTKGRTAFRRNDMKTAASELRRFLTLDPESSDALLAHYYLGAAQYELRDYAEAVTHLETFTSRGRGQKNVDYAYLLQGQTLEQLGRFTEAAETYRKALAAYPGSEFALQMQNRFKQATRRAAGRDAEPEPAAASAQPPATGGTQ